MFKKYICGLMACLFLASSMFLPLGDFSLLRDIPQMYRNYAKVASQDEAGVIDFIGDYLLYGKDLFGHNTHDKTPAKGCDVQFQHQASSTNAALGQLHSILYFVSVLILSHPVFKAVFMTSDYRHKLFRPPHYPAL